MRFLSDNLLLPLAEAPRAGPPAKRAPRMTYDRSAVMRAVKSRDTAPERAVRAMLRAFAPGYRLHRSDLPGKPDIAYGRLNSPSSFTAASGTGTIARAAPMPKTNAAYWRPRSPATGPATSGRSTALAALGWRTLVVHDAN